MRINPAIANQMYLTYSTNDSEDSTCLAAGTYTGLAAAKYVKDNDANKDGVLSSDEVRISAEAYAKLDADSDGEVSIAEMKEALSGQDDAIYAYYKNGGPESGEDLASTLLGGSNAGGATGSTLTKLLAEDFLAEKDADGDGLLDSAESGLGVSVFGKVDADGDGSVSATELKSALAGKSSAILAYYKNGGAASTGDLTSQFLATI